MKRCLTILMVALGLQVWFGVQTVNAQWQKCFGGSSDDYGSSVKVTNDKGFQITGGTDSHDGDVSGNHGTYKDFWAIKTNSMGSILWKKCYGGSTDDFIMNTLFTKDNGIAMVGGAWSNDGDVTKIHSDYDMWVIKLDSMGNKQWSKCYGGSIQDVATSIKETFDGGYIVAGYSNSNDGDVTGNHGGGDVWIVKIDNIGAIQWKKCYGGSGYDRAQSVEQTNDSGYVISGSTASNDGDVTGYHGNGDFWIFKIDKNGILQWQKCYGGSGNEGASSMIKTNDGGFILAGNTTSNDGDVTGNHGGADGWLIKVNSNGELLWQKCLGGSKDDDVSIQFPTIDGGYILSGSTYSNDGDVTGNHGDSDLWLVKVNNIGIIQYQKCFGGTSTDNGGGISYISSDTLLIVGTTKSNDGDVNGNHGGKDLWLIKEKVLNSSPTTIEDKQPNDNKQLFSQYFNISPNPANYNISISFVNLELSNSSISIYNSLGIEIKRFDEKEFSGQSSIKFSTEEFPVGLYYCTFTGKGNIITKSFVVFR